MSGAPETDRALSLHAQLQAIYGPPGGRFGFLAATNHTVIGIRFMGTAIAFFLVGGVLAMLIRAQLSGPATQFLDAAAYAQVFTMHGTVMMFLFAILVGFSNRIDAGAIRREPGWAPRVSYFEAMADITRDWAART